jgi:undecaprenyl pyrophosphate phosphatase UppP
LAESPSEKKEMKKILKYILSKYDPFWTPIVIAAIGVAIYLLRFFENPIEDHIPHLSAIAISLIVVSVLLLVLGGPVDWFRPNDKTKEEEKKYMD